MSVVTFANPLGFLALLAIPAIVAIHFLQRESRRVVVSTLFLLEKLPPESTHGRRWQRLRQSVPLWLQIVAAMLLAWLLAQPRWVRRDSVQRVVLVLDSSVSMLAFQKEVQRAVETRTGDLARLAATTEWQLLESDQTRPVIYAGTDRLRLLRTLEGWEPHLGTHDPQPALALARTHLRNAGSVLFVTDRPTPLPEGVHLMAVGHLIENCGFTSGTAAGGKWQAVLRNHGRARQERSWWVEALGQKSPVQMVTLEPGQALTLSGDFPANATTCELHLSPDTFTVDDRLPLVAAVPKPLTVALEGAPAFAELFQRLLATLEGAFVQPAPVDLRLVTYDPLRPAWPESTAIVFTTDPSTTGKAVAGEVVTENHELTSGLSLSGLLFRSSIQAPRKEGDETLVWMGERPLIFLRRAGAVSYLVVNFDVRGSNALRLPGFVLLLHRFAEKVRQEKVALETRNVELNQALTVASDPTLPPPVLEGQAATALRAPSRPTLFKVRQGERVLVNGAAQFADVREADFREAAIREDLPALRAQLLERNTQPDFLTPVWLLLLAATLFTNWSWRTA